MGIGETHAPEIGHRIILNPNQIIKDPKFEVLQNGSHAINIVVRSDHPQGAAILQDAPAGRKPQPGEMVVFIKVRKFIPIVFHSGDPGPVGTPEVF